MKRFTETNKWRDPWFHKLSKQARWLWLWLLDNCDNAGVIEINFEIATFDIGECVDETHLTELGDRVEPISDRKFWLPKFIPFQCGRLSRSSYPHMWIIEHLEANGFKEETIHSLETTGICKNRQGRLPATLPTTLPTTVGGSAKEKEKEKEQEKDKDKEEEEGCGEKGKDSPAKPKVAPYHPESKKVLRHLNMATARQFRETESSLRPISARLSEPGVDVAGVIAMIDRQVRKWKGSKMEDYLRPETLFGKQKFDSYYAARNQAVLFNDEPPRGPDYSKGL